MPFVEAIRNRWMRIAGGRDQTMIYTEARGYQQSRQLAKEVDHIVPESQIIFEGGDPDASIGIPRSKQHHTGDGRGAGGEIVGYGEPTWSRHPDMGAALESYRGGDKEAFKKAVKLHQVAVSRGQDFTNDDWSLRDWEERRMRDKAVVYRREHPEDPVRHSKGRKRKKRSWTDIFFGRRSYPEDEGR